MIETNSITKYINTNFKSFGVNKQNEITRLLFEIAKRDSHNFTKIIPSNLIEDKRFSSIKRFLLEKRFPEAHKEKSTLKPYLPALDIDPKNALKIKKTRNIAPRNVFIEKSVLNSPLTKRLKQNYPSAHFETISNYKEHIGNKKHTIKDYNARLDNFYITKENFDFFKKCPCSNNSAYCGYHVLNLGFGCTFECAYCYLQEYTNMPGIVLPANIEDFFMNFKEYKKNIRIGTGQFTDSLVFDHISEYSSQIIDFFKNYPKSTFEFKTKSDNVDLLLKTNHGGNIVVSWTLNPQFIIDEVEFYAASLKERLAAAKKCAQAGYKIALHFDPVIYYENWEKDYKTLVDQIFTNVSPSSIAWISIGALRMAPHLKKVIENRFPENWIMDGELFLGYDEKLRYSKKVRVSIYQNMTAWLTQHVPSSKIYFCMEDPAFKTLLQDK